MYTVEIQPTFRRNKEVASRALLPTCCMLVPCLAYSSKVKMDATCSSETSDDFQQTTQRYIPEDRALQLLRDFLRSLQ
jgi:hypothetical protein